MSWFSDLLKKIGRFFKRLWEKIRPFLAIAAIVIGVLAPVIGPILAGLQLPASLGFINTIGTVLEGASWIATSAVGLGIAAVIDPETTGEVIDKVVDVAKDIGEGVGEVLGSATSGFLSGGVGGWLLLGIGAFVVYSMVTSNSGSAVVAPSDNIEDENLFLDETTDTETAIFADEVDADFSDEDLFYGR